MESQLQEMEPGLAAVMGCIADIVKDVSGILRGAGTAEYCGTSNTFGDQQLQVDVEVDNLIFDRLRSCSAVEAASSEEQPGVSQMPGKGYTVVFDPLDGSSIIGANFAVGSIFGIWPGGSLAGRSCRDQVAAAYAVYGPQTLLVWACPQKGNAEAVVKEFLLKPSGWALNREAVRITSEPKYFAPANLRCAGDNPTYAALVDAWVKEAYTLRYTGGMVPDVHHVLYRGGGVFCSPASKAHKAKLRLVYECAPLAFIIEAAGGASDDGRGSILDKVVQGTEDKTIVCLGSPQLVKDCHAAMAASLDL